MNRKSRRRNAHELMRKTTDRLNNVNRLSHMFDLKKSFFFFSRLFLLPHILFHEVKKITKSFINILMQPRGL